MYHSVSQIFYHITSRKNRYCIYLSNIRLYKHSLGQLTLIILKVIYFKAFKLYYYDLNFLFINLIYKTN